MTDSLLAVTAPAPSPPMPHVQALAAAKRESRETDYCAHVPAEIDVKAIRARANGARQHHPQGLLPGGAGGPYLKARCARQLPRIRRRTEWTAFCMYTHVAWKITVE